MSILLLTPPPTLHLIFYVTPCHRFAPFFHPPPLETSPCALGERVSASKKESEKGRGEEGWLVRGEAHPPRARTHAPAPVEN